jgi:hypothetical protein
VVFACKLGPDSQAAKPHSELKRPIRKIREIS